MFVRVRVRKRRRTSGAKGFRLIQIRLSDREYGEK